MWWTWVWINSPDGQGGLACCCPWGHKKSDTAEQLNWTELTQRSAAIDFSTLLLLLAGGRLPNGEYTGGQSLVFQKTILTGIGSFLLKSILQFPLDYSVLKIRCETGCTSHPWGAPTSGSCRLHSCNHILFVCLNPPCVWVTASW